MDIHRGSNGASHDSPCRDVTHGSPLFSLFSASAAETKKSTSAKRGTSHDRRHEVAKATVFRYDNQPINLFLIAV